jgi:hypothetical protein
MHASYEARGMVFPVVYASLLLSSLFSLGGGLVCNGMMGDGRWAMGELQAVI